jgi:oligopeptide/dipeptide ABC transporter ATP-binding protein
MISKPESDQDKKTLLDVRDLKKHFPIRTSFLKRDVGCVRAVDGVSFRIEDGQTMGLVGESGCGKTTVALCILRAIDPTAGQILFRTRDGHTADIATMPSRQLRSIRSDVQMVFQNPFTSLNPRMTVMDIVGEPLLVNGMADRRARADRVAELLQLVGLRPEYMPRFPHAFSGGQRQRIGIARALSLDPRLLVADEPVSALDVSVQAQILNLVKELQERLHLTVLFVSHDLSVIRHICDHVAVMYLGRIVEFAATADLFRTPRHPYTAALLSAVPDPDPRSRGRLVVTEGEVPSPADPPPGCHFHPRCPHAVAPCRAETPLLQAAANGHLVACHRADELCLDGIIDDP